MPLQRVFRFVFSLLVGIGVFASEGVFAEGVPSVLWYPYQSKAAWVSLERAVLPGGKIDWDLFGDLESAPLKRRIESHEGTGCVSMGSLSKHPLNFRTADNVHGLVRNALGIYRGVIVASGVGFADGEPATLLAVRVEETIKPSSKISTERLLYVAYPVAEFSVNGLRICKSDQRLKSVPEVGDSILVFPLNDPLNEEKNLIYPYFQELMVQKRDGTLAIPDKWIKDAALEKASDLREIEGIVRAIEKPAVEKPQKEGL